MQYIIRQTEVTTTSGSKTAKFGLCYNALLEHYMAAKGTATSRQQVFAILAYIVPTVVIIKQESETLIKLPSLLLTELQFTNL